MELQRTSEKKPQTFQKLILIFSFVQQQHEGARKQGASDLAAVLKESMNSPTKPAKMRRMCTQDSQKPSPLSADEALAFRLENNFKSQRKLFFKIFRDYFQFVSILNLFQSKSNTYMTEKAVQLGLYRRHWILCMSARLVVVALLGLYTCNIPQYISLKFSLIFLIYIISYIVSK